MGQDNYGRSDDEARARAAARMRELEVALQRLLNAYDALRDRRSYADITLARAERDEAVAMARRLLGYP